MKVLVSAGFTRHVVFLMIVLTCLISLAPRVEAGFIPSGNSLPDDRQDMAVIQNALEDKVLQQRLLDLGLTQDEIQSRLSQLSVEDRHYLATQIDTLMPAGGTAWTVFVVVVIILAILGLMNLMGRHVIVTK